jgi:hypothetical protein
MIKRTTSVPHDPVPKNNGKPNRNASIAAAAMAAPSLSKLKATNDEGERREEREREAERVMYYPSVVSWRACGGDEAKVRQHTSAYVSIRQHTSSYVSIRQHTSAFVQW